MRELVVISGKGGTGKTSVAAALAVLAERPVVADCDVDAADLHLILAPQVRECHKFYSGHEAVIRREACNGCGECLALCRFGAVCRNGGGGRRAAGAGQESAGEGVAGEKTRVDGASAAYFIDPVACEGCGVCVRFCPQQAIDFPERLCGAWMISETRCGPMVHARLGAAAENSGKLVSTVRGEARRIAARDGRNLVIVDGPPGIGCPVIASVTGATQVLVVTEPTVAGEHDLGRVLELTRHFGIPAAVCVNKWDLNPKAAERIEEQARRTGAAIAGRIRYDRAVTLAQMRERAVVEIEAPSGEDIRRVWKQLGL